MKNPDDAIELHIRPRPVESVSMDVPKETLNSLKRVAANKDMSCEALIKLYIGQGLRQDLSKQFGERVLETTAHVLARHLQSDEEVSAILREIRGEAIP